MALTLFELRRAWFQESSSIWPGFYDWKAAECADLPKEINYIYYDAENEPTFWDDFQEWNAYIEDNGLRLALEQSAHNGVLLDDDLRATRLVTCPPELVRRLNIFLEQCPLAVDEYLAFLNYHVVRVERARRTGSPDWRVHKTADLD